MNRKQAQSVTVTKRKDGRFQARIRGRRNEKPKYLYAHSEKELREKLLAYDRAEEDKACGRTFRQVAEQWQEEHWQTIRYGTKLCYQPAYHRALAAFGERRMKEITPYELKALIDQLAGQRYSSKTVKTQKQVLNMIYNFALIMGDVAVNPVPSIPIPRGLPHQKRQMPSEKELQAVKDHVKTAPFGLFAYLILFTGLRRGEALALRITDFDLEAKTLQIGKSVTFEHNRPVVHQWTKTVAGMRQVLLPDMLIAQITAVKRSKENGYLFSADGGKSPLTEKQFQSRWKRYLQDTGLSITPHQLRHAYATLLYDAGIEDKDAQDLMGHANIAITRDIYTHISRTRRQETAAKLNAFLQR